ncbi:MAG: hypothetical protein ACYDIA_00680 [Candidatus Humimicrobiaceae bacterium]
MKKALMIVAMVAIIVIAGSMIYYFVFFRPGIAKAEIKMKEAQQKQYKITTYDLSESDKIVLSAFMNSKVGKTVWPYNSVQEFLKDIINDKANTPLLSMFDKVKEELIKNTYYAKQIINYSDTEVRFIATGSNKELFISAGYITISQTQ